MKRQLLTFVLVCVAGLSVAACQGTVENPMASSVSSVSESTPLPNIYVDERGDEIKRDGWLPQEIRFGRRLSTNTAKVKTVGGREVTAKFTDHAIPAGVIIDTPFSSEALNAEYAPAKISAARSATVGDSKPYCYIVMLQKAVLQPFLTTTATMVTEFLFGTAMQMATAFSKPVLGEIFPFRRGSTKTIPDQLPKFHTLDIEINGQGPFTAASPLRGGVGLNLYTGLDGFVHLSVRFELDQHTTKHFRLKTIKPGDRIKLTYDAPNSDHGSSIEEIEKLARIEPPELPEGSRLGFDVFFRDGETARLSHPPDGTFNLQLFNVPLDHARIAVHSGNETEDWNWQLEDLYAGDSLELEIVATDWCDPFPNVVRRVVG